MSCIERRRQRSVPWGTRCAYICRRNVGTHSVVLDERHEPRVVVVIQERPDQKLPSPIARLRVPDLRREVGDVPGRVREGGHERVPRRVVEHAVDDLCATLQRQRGIPPSRLRTLTRIVRHVCRAPIVHLPEREDARGLREPGPEVLADVPDGVDPNAVDGVVGDEGLDPVVHGVHDDRVFRVDVYERERLVAEPALFDLGLVLEVGDVAFGVEEERGGEGLVHEEVRRIDGGGHVIDDDVDHEEHVASVQLGAELSKVARVAKVRVERVKVLSPVPVNGVVRDNGDGVDRDAVGGLGNRHSPVVCLAVRRIPLDVRDDRRNPDGVEA